MDANDVDIAIHELKFTAGINQRYHQRLAYWWNLIDKAIKITVGVVAVWSVALSTSGPEYANVSVLVGWVSLAVAVALNVVPTGDYVKDNTDLFRRWSDLYRMAHMIKTRFEIDGAERAGPEIRSRIAEAKETEQQLHATQTAPIMWILRQCERDELRSVYGVDTFAEADDKVWPTTSQSGAIHPAKSAAAAAAAAAETETAGSA